MKAAYKRLIASLSRRDYSEKKLREKLIKFEFPLEEIDEAFAFAKSRGEFVEWRYTEARIRGLVKKGYGPLQVQMKLGSEDISLTKNEIEKVIEENEIDMEEIKKSLRRKFKLRHHGLVGTRELEAKFNQFLFQKGF